MSEEVREFTWRDGERTIRFADGVIADAGQVLAERDWLDYALLTTERALSDAPALAEGAAEVHHVPPGPVNETSAALIDAVKARDLVALGGGRPIDTAKAIAAVRGGRVAALPTTLSGAEMTRIHRLPEGRRADGLVRPALVLADPQAMTSQPQRDLRASAMNALAHGADSLYTPLANPVSRMAALEGARLIATALDDGAQGSAARRRLALGSILCGYAIDSAHLALHHVVCQSLVRVLRTPHAPTNAAILPRAMEALSDRVPRDVEDLALAMGAQAGSVGARIEELGGGRTSLGDLGADRELVDRAIDAMLERSELAAVPRPPDRRELRHLVESAW